MGKMENIGYGEKIFYIQKGLGKGSKIGGN
jgi:hypothetical protein